MKELSIEQKAKAYDEALKYGRYLIDTRCKEGSDGSFHRSDLEKMFSELAESEDERIRKELLKHCTNAVNGVTMCVSTGDYARWLAWLEKQGEHKQEWSLQDEKNLDDIFCAIRLDNALSDEKQDRLICWLQQYRPYMHKEHKPAWSEEDKVILDEIIDFFENGTVKLQHDLSLYASWLKSLKQRVQPQPKREWSEDDDEKFRDVIRFVEQGAPVQSYRDHYTNWLKSLKERIGGISYEI